MPKLYINYIFFIHYYFKRYKLLLLLYFSLFNLLYYYILHLNITIVYPNDFILLLLMYQHNKSLVFRITYLFVFFFIGISLGMLKYIRFLLFVGDVNLLCIYNLILNNSSSFLSRMFIGSISLVLVLVNSTYSIQNFK